MRVRAAQRFQPSAGVEPGEREDHRGRGRRRERPRGEIGAGGPVGSRAGRGVISASLSRPPNAAEMEQGARVSEGGRRPRRARAGSALGAAQQQRHFCTTTEEVDHACHSGTPLPYLRRTHPPRAAARRVHRTVRPQPRELPRAAEDAAKAATKFDGARGFGSAKSVIMIFLQGGPSHIDIWDPKPDAPVNIRGEFKAIPTKIPGTHIGEHMPMMAQRARQGDAHPLDELHAERPVQPHRRDLPDADRLPARQRVAVGPARAAQPRRLPHRRQPRLEAEAAQGSRAPVRRAAAPAAGIGRHRQGRRRGLPRQGLRPVPPVPGPGEAASRPRTSRCARTSRPSA